MNTFSSNSTERSEIERRRRFPRYRTNLLTNVTLLGQTGYVTVRGHCTELAEGGLGVMVSADLASGEIVSVELWIPNLKEPLALRAVVRRQAGLSYGLEFVSILPDQCEAIRTFCSGLPPA
jgi:hypothetical protein